MQNYTAAIFVAKTMSLEKHDCKHHWIIAEQNGERKLLGKCKKCESVKYFDSSFDWNFEEDYATALRNQK